MGRSEVLSSTAPRLDLEAAHAVESVAAAPRARSLDQKWQAHLPQFRSKTRAVNLADNPHTLSHKALIQNYEHVSVIEKLTR